jgi:hypothetical protein
VDYLAGIEQHSHWDRFQAYHLAHPETYRFFIAIAREAKRRGIDHGSIKALIEYGRWETSYDFSLGSGFSHDFQSIYSRLIMEREPDLRGFFEIRELKAVKAA